MLLSLVVARFAPAVFPFQMSESVEFIGVQVGEYTVVFHLVAELAVGVHAYAMSNQDRFPSSHLAQNASAGYAKNRP